MPDPDRVVFAGDWHGARAWAVGVIDMLPDLLPDESPRRIVHCGDLGYWPGSAGERYLAAVDRALKEADGELWFADGNHEWHEQLQRLAADVPGRSRLWLTDRVHWLMRGHRWSWHHRTWLALGGATSVDRPIRTPGVDWWPEEAITYRQGVEVIAGGLAEVMVCHDCPAGVPLKLPNPPAWWEMEPAENHRDVLAEIVTEVQPRWLMHGHYHLAHDTTVTMTHGAVQVTGLAADGAPFGNYRVLNVRTMTWETP